MKTCIKKQCGGIEQVAAETRKGSEDEQIF